MDIAGGKTPIDLLANMGKKAVPAAATVAAARKALEGATVHPAAWAPAAALEHVPPAGVLAADCAQLENNLNDRLEALAQDLADYGADLRQVAADTAACEAAVAFRLRYVAEEGATSGSYPSWDSIRLTP